MMDTDEDGKTDVIAGGFANPWPGSDVVVRCKDLQKDIHFSRRVFCSQTWEEAGRSDFLLLATYSPYFEALFFHNWKEKEADVVSLEEEYDVILDVFRIISNGGRTDYSKPLKPEKLAKMYTFSDKRDIKVVRDICQAQLWQQPTYETLEAAIKLELEGLKDALLVSMKRKQLLLFLNSNDSSVTLSKKDLKLIIDRVSCTTDESKFLRASPSTIHLPSRTFHTHVIIKNVGEVTLACRFSSWLFHFDSFFTFLRPGNSISMRVYRKAVLLSGRYEVDFIRVDSAKGDAKDVFITKHRHGTLSIPVDLN